MAQLARIDLVATPACPNCRKQVPDLDLDALAGGGEHQCLYCGHSMRVPKTVLDRLIAQREAARSRTDADGWWAKVQAFFAKLFAG